jgi:hypothetical protein
LNNKNTMDDLQLIKQAAFQRGFEKQANLSQILRGFMNGTPGGALNLAAKGLGNLGRPAANVLSKPVLGSKRILQNIFGSKKLSDPRFAPVFTRDPASMSSSFQAASAPASALSNLERVILGSKQIPNSAMRAKALASAQQQALAQMMAATKGKSMEALRSSPNFSSGGSALNYSGATMGLPKF